PAALSLGPAEPLLQRVENGFCQRSHLDDPIVVVPPRSIRTQRHTKLPVDRRFGGGQRWKCAKVLVTLVLPPNHLESLLGRIIGDEHVPLRLPIQFVEKPLPPQLESKVNPGGERPVDER